MEDVANVGVDYIRAHTDSGPQGVLEAHGDMEPIEHNGRLGQHAALELPKPLITVR